MHPQKPPFERGTIPLIKGKCPEGTKGIGRREAPGDCSQGREPVIARAAQRPVAIRPTALRIPTAPSGPRNDGGQKQFCAALFVGRDDPGAPVVPLSCARRVVGP